MTDKKNDQLSVRFFVKLDKIGDRDLPNVIGSLWRSCSLFPQIKSALKEKHFSTLERGTKPNRRSSSAVNTESDK